MTKIRVANVGPRAVKLLAMALCLAMCLSLAPPAPSAGEDVGRFEVEALVGAPPNFVTYDLCWNAENTICVAVGAHITTYDEAAYYWNTLWGYWSPLSFTSMTEESSMNGVDWDQDSNCFVIVGGDGGAWNTFVWLFYPGGGLVDISYTITPGEGVGQDVAVYAQQKYVVILHSGGAYEVSYQASVWIGNEILGALPADALNSVEHDSTHGLVYLYGSQSGPYTTYFCYDNELYWGFYYAYAMSPPGATNEVREADWGPKAHCALEVGPSYLGKLLVKHSNIDPDFATADVLSQEPPMRVGTAVAYASSTSCYYMFGGYNVTMGSYLQDTWMFNIFTRQWTLLNPATRPPTRAYHAMAYNEWDNYIVMYGGERTFGLSDTWLFFPGNQTWWQKTPTQVPPGSLPAQYGHAMVYSSQIVAGYDRGVVMFGGDAGSTSVFLYTNSPPTWRQLTSLGDARVARYNHAMAWNSPTSSIVIFGGNGQEAVTSVYYPTTNYWDEKGISGPPGRVGASMDFTNRLGSMFLYGGFSNSLGYFNDTWFYDDNGQEGGGSWTQITGIAGNRPALRHQRMLRNNVDNGLYIFGGEGSAGMNPTTYKYGRIVSFQREQVSDTNFAWNDVAWRPGSSEALFVGDSGHLARYVNSTKTFKPVEFGGSQSFYAVGYKGAASPSYAYVMGTAGGGVKVNDISSGTTFNVSVASPWVHNITLQEYTYSTYVMNRQVDVDTGNGQTIYNLDVRAGHEGGADLITQVDVYGWYDQGNMTTDFPSTVTPNFDSPGWENQRFHFVWWRGNGSFWRAYPKTRPGDEEITLNIGPGGSQWGSLGMNLNVRFQFCPRQQMHASGGMFVEPPGSQYGGGGNGSQSTIMALNAPDTWDIKAVASAGLLNAAAYDEFGFFKYTYLTSANLPGSLSGSGAPGSTVHLSPVGHVTFASNCYYRLLVYVDQDLEGQNLHQFIPASRMAVRGGNLENWSWPMGTWEEQNFNGSGVANALYLFGSLTVYDPPMNNGRWTSTSRGNVGAVAWRCWVPNVPEDRYTTSVTFVLQRA
jgi:hypothetical protein